MNPNDLLQQGISAVRNGNKKEGAQKLAQVVQQESRNAEAWFWLAAATDDPNEAAACLRRVLKIDPNHTRAQQALGALEQGGGISQVNTPAPSEPSGGNMRPLNTGELLSGSMAFDTPYGSYTPPPISRPEQPTRTMPTVNPNAPAPFSENMTPAPNITGNDPTPPPPFGMPAWANQAPPAPNPRDAQTARVNMPDPYAAGQPGTPPPPFQKGGTGLSFSQLDPAAAQAQQAAQAVPAPTFDSNADLRSKLLGNNQATQATPPPPPFQGGGNKATFVPDPNLKQQPVKKGNNRRTPLLILVIAIVLFGVAAVALLVLKPGSSTNIATNDTSTPAVTDTANVSLTPSPSAGTTTALVATTTAAPVTTTTSIATTTAANNTAAPTATLPGNKTIAPISSVATTTAANATTTAAPATTTVVATTTQSGTRTIAPLTTTVANRTTTAAPATTTPAPVTTTAAPGTTAAPATTTPSGGSTYPLPIFGAEVPLPVVSYVTNANELVNGMSFIDTNINRLLFKPFNDANQKVIPGSKFANSIIGNPELDYYLVELGQLARKLKDTRVADETPWLGTYTNDYANHLTDMLNYIDTFKSTGQEYFLKVANSFYDKASSDRTNWGNALKAGYPFKIPAL